jgi:putative endonuclease
MGERYTKGIAAEQQAAVWLEEQGWRILRQRCKTPYGEIDILAEKETILLVVEVKARKTVTEGLEAVSRRQQQRLANALAWFYGQHPEYNNHDLRLDAIVVLPDSAIHHIPQAWMCE